MTFDNEVVSKGNKKTCLALKNIIFIFVVITKNIGCSGDKVKSTKNKTKTKKKKKSIKILQNLKTYGIFLFKLKKYDPSLWNE